MKKSWKLALPALFTLFMLILSACATEPGTTTTDTPGTGGDTGSTGGATTKYYVDWKEYDIEGAKQKILVAEDGYTLYYFKNDTETESACKGGCLTNWPAYTYNGTDANVSHNPDLKGKFEYSAETKHLKYNGYYLYKFSGDKKPGDLTGHKSGNSWYVVLYDIPAKGTGGS